MCGFAARRIGFPVIVGYLLGGVGEKIRDIGGLYMNPPMNAAAAAKVTLIAQSPGCNGPGPLPAENADPGRRTRSEATSRPRGARHWGSGGARVDGVSSRLAAGQPLDSSPAWPAVGPRTWGVWAPSAR